MLCGRPRAADRVCVIDACGAMSVCEREAGVDARSVACERGAIRALVVVCPEAPRREERACAPGLCGRQTPARSYALIAVLRGVMAPPKVRQGWPRRYGYERPNGRGGYERGREGRAGPRG